MQWSEQVSPAEGQRHEEFSKDLGRVQKKMNRRFGLGRALHRKQVQALTATVKIRSGLPQYARHGLFAEPGAHEAVVRLSNGSPSVQDNKVPDVRGFALSVRGISGEGALGGTTDRQDFLLINRSSFGFRTSEEFSEVALAASRGQLDIAKALIARYGTVRGPIELSKLIAGLARPFTGFSSTTFHSAAPIQVGPYAAHVRLLPRQGPQGLTARIGFGNAIADQLRDSHVAYDLFLDFFVDEETTPIEDGSKEWPVEELPSVHVAGVSIGKQDVDSASGKQLAAQVSHDHFDPWSALAAHRPLGEIMRARRVAYYASQQARKA